MKVLGITMSIPLHNEMNIISNTYGFGHDSAAVLVENGTVVAGIEEERLNRIKHTNKAPISAMKFCLQSNNLKLEHIDKIAVNFDEMFINSILKEIHLIDKKQKEFYDARFYVQRALNEAFGETIEDNKIVFVPHHIAHAESTFKFSGFNKSLVLVIDGMGDNISGIVQSVEENKTETLYTIPYDISLGRYYLDVIRYLGYVMFDEYKVMGLAPYGDPIVYEAIFKKLYRLLPDGNFGINFGRFSQFYDLGLPRRKGEPFTQVHKNISASLQYSLEEIVLHLIKHYKKVTNHSKLCMAGGVAHNCSLNGKILYSGLFDDIFVQPASHDAGGAIGAALYVTKSEMKDGSSVKLDHVYWGTDVSESKIIVEELDRWNKFIDIKKSDNIVNDTAKLLAEGSVIGWVQGRSEFGPRALGNRSILADPRPPENKDIINKMVKKREAYRPFAPSVLEEHVEEYFVIPTSQKQFPFMNFVLKVKEEKQSILGAITHVDGTARIQTVSKASNPMYWNLINEFSKYTGVHILLNTSFNNNAEPIVDSVYDAIVCFLTTKPNMIWSFIT